MNKAVSRLVGWTVSVALLAVYPSNRLSAQDTLAGKRVYEKWCAGCHGDGAGDGPAAAYMLPRPRDFTGAIYKIRSTASGQLPTDADLMRAIDLGLPGTAMPAWKGRLSDGERRDVMAYLKTFSAFFADTSQRVEPLTFGTAPPSGGGTSAEALTVGRQFYDSIGCGKCHGSQGRGDGPSAPTLKDDAGFPIFAADLHQNWQFRGGGTVEDIYRRLRTGLDGTPMPSFSDLIDQKFLTDEELWRLAQYVRSLSPAKEPAVRDVIHAPQLEGPVPTSPDDSAWARVERYWFPLVGQIIRKSRWFAPAVSGVWAQAAHDGKEVALRLSWEDRSQSPDTAWLAFAERVLETMASDDSLRPRAGLWPDQVAVQFPRRIPEGPEGMARPYFLMGTATDPVYQWRWTSAGGAGGGRWRDWREASSGSTRSRRRRRRRRSTITGNGAWCSRAPLRRPIPRTNFSLGRAAPFRWPFSPGTAPTGSSAPGWPSARGISLRSTNLRRRGCSSPPSLSWRSRWDWDSWCSGVRSAAGYSVVDPLQEA